MAQKHPPHVKLLAGMYGWHFILRSQHGDEITIQFDWDYRRYASAFGWSVQQVRPELGCPHEATDGTVPCRNCGLTPSDFLSHAGDFLAANIGRSILDPGFFSGAD